MFLYQRLEESKVHSRPIATELKQAAPVWPSKKYHRQYLERGGRFGGAQSAEKGEIDPLISADEAYPEWMTESLDLNRD